MEPRAEEATSTAWASMWLGATAQALGNLEMATAPCQQALSTFRDVNDPGGIETTLNFLGITRRLQGDYAGAVEAHEEALRSALHQDPDDPGVGPAMLHLGTALRYQGDLVRAKALLTEGLRLLSAPGRSAWWRQGRAGGLRHLAGIFRQRSEPERAARLLGASQALAETDRVPDQPHLHPEYEVEVAATRAELDEETFQVAFAEGRSMTVDQAIAYALEEHRPPPRR